MRYYNDRSIWKSSAASLSKYKSNCRVTRAQLFAVNVRLAPGLVHSDKGKFYAVPVSDSGSSFEGFFAINVYNFRIISVSCIAVAHKIDWNQ